MSDYNEHSCPHGWRMTCAICNPMDGLAPLKPEYVHAPPARDGEDDLPHNTEDKCDTPNCTGGARVTFARDGVRACYRCAAGRVDHYLKTQET